MRPGYVIGLPNIVPGGTVTQDRRGGQRPEIERNESFGTTRGQATNCGTKVAIVGSKYDGLRFDNGLKGPEVVYSGDDRSQNKMGTFCPYRW